MMKLGFIGGGTNSAVGATHRIASQMDHRWEIVAGCFSQEEQVNAETGVLCGVEPRRVYGNWEELLRSEVGSLDAVAVLTPIPLHKEIVLRALERRFPVICEKALAVSSADAREMREAAEQRKGFLAVTYNYTGYPMLRELRRMVRDGAVGAVNQVHVEMPQEGYVRVNQEGKPNVPQAWRLVDDVVPTLSLDLGAHLHNIVGFLTGETPVEAVAVHGSHGAFRQVVDNAIGMVRYSSGFICHMWYSKCALGHRNGLRVRVYGEKGSAEWYQANPEVLNWCDARGNQRTHDRSSADAVVSSEPRYDRFKVGHPAGFIEAFANHYYDLADCLELFRQTGEFQSPWVFGGDHAEEGLRLLEALAKSAKSKCWEGVS
jgi:predicted dehydrogenase